MVNVWTDEAVATLREMWPTHTATVIGARLKVTRNAVIGKAGRLGLAGKKPANQFTVVAKADRQRQNMSAQTHRAGAKNTGNGGGIAIKLKRKGKRVWNNIRRPENVRPPMRIEPILAPRPPLNLTLMQLGSDQCHFIAGEPSGGCYCGHPVEKRDLCSFHYRLCWREEPVTFKRRASEREFA